MKKRILALLFVAILLQCCSAPHLHLPEHAPSSSKAIDDYTAFVETVNDNFIDTFFSPIKLDTTNHPPIDSLIRQTDDHSSIVYRKTLGGARFGALGLTIRMSGMWPVILLPLEGGNAARAGMLPNDTVVSIDGISTQGISVDSVLFLSRGHVGSIAAVSIKRDSVLLPVISVSREVITQQNVSYACMIEKNIGYVRITNFSAGTAYDLADACISLRGKDCKVLILDVRNNCGGLLSSAIACSGLFLKKGSPVCTVRQHPRIGNKAYQAVSGRFAHIPLIVIVNRYTFSGAELFANALKDNYQARIVGSKTAGLGNVQTVIDIRPSYSIKLTTGYLVSPAGRLLQGPGLIPDVKVPETGKFVEIQYPVVSGNEGTDKQLMSALKNAREFVR